MISNSIAFLNIIIPVEWIPSNVFSAYKDVFCLLYDRAELGIIKSIKGGIFGT